MQDIVANSKISMVKKVNSCRSNRIEQPHGRAQLIPAQTDQIARQDSKVILRYGRTVACYEDVRRTISSLGMTNLMHKEYRINQTDTEKE